MKNITNHSGDIVIYQSEDGNTRINVNLQGETVWLSANQMAILFDRDEKTIRKHINNVFSEGELPKKNNTQKMRVDDVKQAVAFYTLDVIISVGYRVKSKRGTQFRIWANKILKEYLIKGFAINDKITQRKYEELSQLVHILGRTINSQPELSSQENLDLINVVTDYTYALDTLDKYDYQKLKIEKTTFENKFIATYDNAILIIQSLKEKLVETGCSEMKKMILSKVPSDRFIRLSMVLTSTLLSKKRRQCCCILLRKTILSVMETSVSPRLYFFGSCRTMAFYITLMVPNESAMEPWSPSL